jgi:cellulose synthase/poly-beta-1,6-N-acetylglucosamine synthase-like glycosyltransferase
LQNSLYCGIISLTSLIPMVISSETILFYLFAFCAIYAQVFLFLIFITRRKDIVRTVIPVNGFNYPEVTIIVPCWNEENTVSKTVQSLVDLDYPKDKLKILLIDDGSTDKTFEKMNTFKNVPNISIIQKENGGKHTAMNLGIQSSKTEFIGCLDADAFVDSDALKKIITYFKNEKVMAVSPSIVVHNPRNIIEKAQKVEYHMSVFIKKVLGLVGGIHVTPGPFSIYRRKVFQDLGLYKKAHNTEDMEIAYRMQVNGYKIEQCHDAFVSTVTPRTAYKLYRQRIRWIYGFINNSIDYRKYLFKPKLGVFSIFTVPSAVISLALALYLTSFSIVSATEFIRDTFVQAQVSGVLSLYSTPTFDWFFIDTSPVAMTTSIIYIMVLVSILIGQRMSKAKPIPGISFVWFMMVYALIGPFWILRAVFNTIFTRRTSWR